MQHQGLRRFCRLVRNVSEWLVDSVLGQMSANLARLWESKKFYDIEVAFAVRVDGARPVQLYADT